MKADRVRLLLASLLFFGWVGWLAYLAITAAMAPAIVLSRPQFLVSNLDVIAQVEQIEDKLTPVKVVEVHWPAAEKERLKDKTIQVAGLADCRKDWQGPGPYILPLVHSGQDKYTVAAIPHSPGFPPPPSQTDQPRVYRIYPANPKTLQQLEHIPKLER